MAHRVDHDLSTYTVNAYFLILGFKQISLLLVHSRVLLLMIFVN